MTTIDINKVKAALQRYAPTRVSFPDRKPLSPPADSSRRKVVRTMGQSCRGFTYFNK